MNSSANFWNFSVELYASEGVADACLSLQNSYGLDVNLILFCYWYGHRRGELSDEILQQALDFSSSWRQRVVQPLRDVRTRMKQSGPALESLLSQYEALRERVKLDELAAEKYQQQVLETIAAKNQSPLHPEAAADAADHNIECLLAKSGVTRESGLESSLATIARMAAAISST